MDDTVKAQAGALLITGGNEDREHDMAVHDRFGELSGGRHSHIVVVTAASDIGDEVYDQYTTCRV